MTENVGGPTGRTVNCGPIDSLANLQSLGRLIVCDVWISWNQISLLKLKQTKMKIENSNRLSGWFMCQPNWFVNWRTDYTIGQMTENQLIDNLIDYDWRTDTLITCYTWISYLQTDCVNDALVC